MGVLEKAGPVEERLHHRVAFDTLSAVPSRGEHVEESSKS
jgi:hypothetical protein